MSVYSGFATRQQQQRYNDCLQILLIVLIKRIMKFYRGDHCEEGRFRQHLIHLHQKMFKMQQSKYMQPHFSHVLLSMLTEFQKISVVECFPQQKVHFDASSINVKESVHRIKFNSIDHLSKDFDNPFESKGIRKDSFETLKGTPSKFRSRIKATTPEKVESKKDSSIQYFTPQKSNLEDVQYELPTFKKQEALKKEEKSSRKVKKVPKLEKPVKTDHVQPPLSPRQFLRQTVMDRQSSHALGGLRMKQKHHKKVQW